MNKMKHYRRFLLLLLATFMLTSCHDDDEPIDEPTEPSMPSTILATNSLHTAPACSLSMLSLTNTTLSVGQIYRIVKEFFKKGKKVPQNVYCYFTIE